MYTKGVYSMNDLNNCKLTFTNKDTGNSTSMTLYSHFSLILGKDSGEGKTHFFERMATTIPPVLDGGLRLPKA